MTNLATAWTAAAKAEQDAREAAERFHATYVRPVDEAHERGEVPLAAVHEQEQAYAECNALHQAAFNALLTTPAPSLQAVARKLRLGCQDWLFDGSSQSIAALEAIAADVERLDASADPTPWESAIDQLATASQAFAAEQSTNPAGDELDALCNAMTDAEDTLFGMDAPHMQAALWKLDYLSHVAKDTIITPDQLRKVSNDIRRLIGEA